MLERLPAPESGAVMENGSQKHSPIEKLPDVWQQLQIVSGELGDKGLLMPWTAHLAQTAFLALIDFIVLS